MKINTILFRLFRNGEFLQLMKNILKIILQSPVAGLQIKERVSDLKTLVDGMDNAFMPKGGEELTPELKVLDARRDKALMGIKQYLQTFLYREEEDLTTAAEKLLLVYENHGKRIDKLPYQQETAVINALLKDYASHPELNNALKTLTLSHWTTLLSDINKQFDDTYVNRAINTDDEASLNEKREAIRKAYIDLEEDIEAYARIGEDNEQYIALIKSLNGLIDDYNQAAENRIKSKDVTEDVIIAESE